MFPLICGLGIGSVWFYLTAMWSDQQAGKLLSKQVVTPSFNHLDASIQVGELPAAIVSFPYKSSQPHSFLRIHRAQVTCW